jgi:hypothetical protein
MEVISKTFIDPQLARQFGKDYIKILTALLLKNNIASRPGLRPYPKNATGNLIRSLDYRLRQTAQGVVSTIYAEPYLTYVDRGRKAYSKGEENKKPPMAPLLAWARVKGLPQSAAYGARENIWRFGIKPTNVIKRSMTIYENSRENNRKYEERMVNNIIKIIENNYNAAVAKATTQ